MCCRIKYHIFYEKKIGNFLFIERSSVRLTLAPMLNNINNTHTILTRDTTYCPFHESFAPGPF